MEFPLRSLLYTAGTATATAIIYYFIRESGKKTDADSEEAFATEDSGSLSDVPQDQAVPASPCPTAENEADKYQEAQLENENLWKNVEILRDTIHYMKILTFETQNKYNQERERDQKAHNTLQLKHDEMTKKLQQNSTSLDQLEKKHVKTKKSLELLQLEKSSLMNGMEILNGRIQDNRSQICETLKKQEEVQAEMKYQEAQMEIENLKKYVETLRGTIQDMQIVMYETQNKHNQARERDQKAFSGVLLNHEEMTKKLQQHTISKNEAQSKCREPQLENNNLKKYVETLRGTIQDMQILLYETQNKHNQERERDRKAHESLQLKHEETIKKLQHYNELLSECERERVAYQNLTMKFSNKKESLNNIKALIKSSLYQVREKHQKAMESFINLQFEMSNLMKDVETLKGTIQDMGNLIYETQKEQNEEYERVFRAYSALHLERQQMKKSLNRCESLLTEYETEQEAQNYLRFEHNGMKKTLEQTEELLKESLAEVLGKHRKAMKSIAQLECSLVDKSETLQENMQKMERLIAESQKTHDEEFDQERKAHNILQSVVEKFHHSEEL